MAFQLYAILILCFTSGAVFAQNPSYLSWREYETDHFIIYYAEGQEFTAYNAAEVAESAHPSLVAMYGPLDTKVSIVVKDTEDYANGGAYFYDNKVEISATSLDFEFRSPTDWLWNVVTHELTHIYSIHQAMKAPRWMPMAYYQQIDYQDEKREDVLVGYPNVMASYPIPMFNVPAWLAEGIAQYQTSETRHDRWDAHRDMILRQAVLNDSMLSIDQMGIFNWTGRENEMVYNHGYSLTSYIGAHYGEDKVAALIRAMASADDFTFGQASKRVLGLPEDTLYDEWTASLKEHYAAVRDSLGTLVEGRLFRKGGYLNGFPTWSPDGSRLAYVSNAGQDYSLTVCRIANLESGGWSWKGKDKDERELAEELDKQQRELSESEYADAEAAAAGSFDISLGGGIQSRPVWLDEWNILFNRRMPSDKYGSHWWDIYRYVINTEDPRKGTRTRITESLRGTYPTLSPDGSELVFVKNEAGLNNLYIMNRDDNAITQLTHFSDGTRFYGPRWSPDGRTIAVTFHRGDEVDVAIVDRATGSIRYLASSSGQDRDPAWTSDGKSIIFSSDVTGIPNLYRIGVDTGDVARLTNVIGGAFAPDVSPADTTVAFSYYGPDGYEIHLLDLTDGTTVQDNSRFHTRTGVIEDSPDPAFDLSKSKPYRMKTLDFSFLPVVRNDQGNMKFGGYLLKSEVIDQGNFFFMGAISPTNRDTDIAVQFEYDRFIPTVFIEMYRQTRSVDTTENYMEEFGTITHRRVYDLNEMDFGLRYLYHDSHEFESRLIYSQYNAKVEYTHFLTGPQVHKPYYTYSRGFDLALTYRYDEYLRTRDEIINPRGGRKVTIRLDRFTNFFLDDFEYVGFLREKYKRYPYNQYFVDWTERIPVPGTRKHTLVLRGLANIIDRQVDSFYENQLGGPYQMRGYTFYSLTGRKNIMGQALYRFPIWHDIRKKFWVWDFNHLYMGVFTDIGRAWNKQSLNWSTSGFKRDAGIELRLDALSFYNFPTMIEVAAAYGPDDTWIQQFDETNSTIQRVKDKQDPWKFYLSVLFGFN